MKKLFYKYVVIEDDFEANASIVAEMKPYVKWKCIGATASLTEGLEIIIEHQPDLLFLDFEVKGGNTFKILENIKFIENYQPYIIFFTGFQDEQPQIPTSLINNYQVNKYLVKPIFEDFTKNLQLFIPEAEQLIKDKDKHIWITTDKKERIKIEPSQIICISQCKKANSRSKVFHLFSGEEYEYKITWEECEKIAQENKIDYFFANSRECMVNKEYIIRKQKPLIYLSCALKNLKVEVSKSNWDDVF